jgi:CelD/BcsL family acetyltransferase involved in cellulose biosynthesis
MNSLCLGRNLFIKKISDLSAEESSRWDSLVCSETNLRRAFLSRSYVSQVDKISHKVRVLVVYVENEPEFFLPVQRRKGLLSAFGIYEPVGGVMTDYFGAIARPGFQIDPTLLLEATKGKINAIWFSHLDQSQAVLGLTGKEPRIGLLTLLGDPPSEYWSNLRKIDKKLVSDTERREKKFQKEVGNLSFEWESSTPIDDLKWLIKAKQSQYNRTGKAQAPLFDRRNTDLLRSLCQAREDSCRGVLSVLRCDDEIIAAHFGLKCHEVLHVWFPVYNASFAHFSPGRILLKYMFMAAANSGINVFDRGEGDSQAKRDFANKEHVYTRGLWLTPGVLGMVAHLVASLAWRYENKWLRFLGD